MYPPDVQGGGEFDGGRIPKTKPLGFPGEGLGVPYTGPLFYWARATAKGGRKIGLHLHRGFRIMNTGSTGVERSRTGQGVEKIRSAWIVCACRRIYMKHLKVELTCIYYGISI